MMNNCNTTAMKLVNIVLVPYQETTEQLHSVAGIKNNCNNRSLYQ